MSDCDCYPPRTNPCPERASLICDPAYYSMVTLPRLRLLGVAAGSNCQSYLAPKRGFLFDDGSGAGQFISEQPQLTLPIINALSGVTYSAPPGFPFIVVGTGSDPHLWNFMRGQTGQPATLTWDGTQFVMTPAGGGDTQTAVCSALNSASVGLFGCVVSGDGFVLKKLNAINTRVIVGAIDGSGNQSFHSLTDSEPLKHPLGQFTTLRWNAVQALNDDGTDTAGGLPTLVTYGTGAVTDATLGYYSPTTKKFYRAPTGYVLTRTDFETGTLVANTPAAEFTFSNVILNYSTLQVSATINVGASKRLTLEVLVDGLVQQTWTNSDGSTAVSASISGTAYIKNITPGVHTVLFRLTCVEGGSVRAAVASIATSNIPL